MTSAWLQRLCMSPVGKKQRKTAGGSIKSNHSRVRGPPAKAEHKQNNKVPERMKSSAIFRNPKYDQKESNRRNSASNHEEKNPVWMDKLGWGVIESGRQETQEKRRRQHSAALCAAVMSVGRDLPVRVDSHSGIKDERERN